MFSYMLSGKLFIKLASGFFSLPDNESLIMFLSMPFDFLLLNRSGSGFPEEALADNPRGGIEVA